MNDFEPKKSYKIFGITYKVKITYDGIEDGTLGWCDTDKKEIRIRPDLDDREMKITLLHEIGHAAFEESGLVFLKLSDNDEDMVVDNLAKAMVSAFEIGHKN